MKIVFNPTPKENLSMWEIPQRGEEYLIGVDVSDGVEGGDASCAQVIKRSNFQLFSLTWTGVTDPDIYSLILHSQRIPPAGSNRGRYRNPEFDALVDQGARLADPALRRPFYLKAQELVARDLPYISLLTKVNVAVMPSALAGYRNFPSGELYGLKDLEWRRGGRVGEPK